MRLKHRLMIAVAAAVPLASYGVTPAALAQNANPIPAVDSSFAGQQGQNYQVNSWTASFFLNSTDNFSRIEEGDYRRLFQLDDGTFLTQTSIVDNGDGTFTQFTNLVEDTVAIDPAEKVFGTVNLSGFSTFNRPNMRGLVRGQVRVGSYLDQENVEDRNQDTITANLPQEAIDAGATPTIGDFAVQSAFVDPNISGIVEFDLLGDAIGMEAGGFVIEQGRVQGSQLQAQQPGQNFNQIVLGGLFLSPVFNANLANDQKLEFRLRNSSIFVLDEPEDEAALAVLPVQQINDSVSNEAQLSYQTGELLGPVKADLELFVRDLTEDGSLERTEQELEQRSGSLTLQVPVSGTLSLTAAGGYDDVVRSSAASSIIDPDTGLPEEPAQTEDFSGFFYSVGFKYSPSRDSRVSFAIGERYQGLAVQALSSIALTPRLQWRLQAERRVNSSVQDQQEQLRFFNIAVLNIMDQLRASNEVLSSRSIGQSVNPIIRNITADSQANFGIRPRSQVQTQLIGSYSRNTVVLRAGAILLDDDETTGQRNVGQNQYNSSLSVSRLVNRRLRVTAASQAQFLDGLARDANVSFDSILDQFYTLQASYQLSSNVALSGSFQHLRRDIQGFEQDTLSLFGGRFFEYRENQLRGGIQVRF
ncbi:MAG: hypothetical protein HRU11_10215 [Parvularculaceae bacterium]|nr:hypothetical protein [Parvularculaceae bacterium]